MNKIDKIILFVFIVLFCGSAMLVYRLFSHKTNYTKNMETKTVQIVDDYDSNNFREFTDGLHNPDSVKHYNLDEFGAGVAEQTFYSADINNDNIPDRITKTLIETGNAHSYYKYKIEIKSGNKYIDVTPENLQTTNGDDCDLQQIQFVLKPVFKIIVIYRDFGDTWNQPTMARKRVYGLSKNNKIVSTKPVDMKPVCDVKTLF